MSNCVYEALIIIKINQNTLNIKYITGLRITFHQLGT